MQYKDTLTMYQELLEARIEKEHAYAIVRQIYELQLQLSMRIDELEYSLLNKIEAIK